MNNRLKELRKKYLHLTQQEFGKKIGLTDVAISRYEKGERNISQQVFISICREFNVNEEWLRTGEGEIFNYSENDTLIEKISAEYNLDNFQKKLVQKYLELTDQQKAAVKSFLDKVYEEEFTNHQASSNSDEDNSDEYITVVAARGDSHKHVKLSKKAIENDLINYTPPDYL